MQQTINYDALTRLKPEVLTLKHTLVVFAFFALFAVTLLDNAGIESAWLLPSLVACAVFGVGTLIIRSQKQQQAMRDALKDFASTNKLTYMEQDSRITLPGSLFQEGHTRKIEHVVSGAFLGFPFRSYEYRYNTGSGKSETTHDAMVLEVSLPRVLPQFVIDSQLEMVIPLVFDRSQKIELEGDFHKYFDLYAPDNYGVTALTILAPDAMEVVMQHAVLCDIEVVQDRLYFYWAKPARSSEQYQKMYETAQAVLGKIGEELTTQDIYASSDQARVHATPSATGERLKRHNVTKLAILFIIVYISLMVFGPVLLGEFAGLSSLLFWVVLFVIIGVGSVRQSRLKRDYLSRYTMK